MENQHGLFSQKLSMACRSKELPSSERQPCSRQKQCEQFTR